jgi:hypothetical protein
MGYIVAVGASLLITPLLWSHYLVALLLPAAYLADRVRLPFIALPLLGWLPLHLVPFVAIAATFLPFLAWSARPQDDERPSPVTRDSVLAS